MTFTLPSADLVRAELAADSLRDFVPLAWPLVEMREFKANWHIDAICDHLQAVSTGEIRRLIVNIPPRCMKSLGVGVFWPAWEWLRHPDTQFMFASYAQRLTVRDSLKCRRLVESRGARTVGGTLMERVGYQGLLGLIGQDWQLATDQREKMKFENDQFGYRLATSIGGTGTGEGGDRLVIDDPHKADEAESEVERENVIDWLDGTLSTRLNDPTRGAIVVVMQRLHEKDATGHLLEQGGYVHLCLPMEYEPTHPFVWPGDPRTGEGDLLWPARIPRENVDELKMRLGSYRAAGQLQQRPAPAEGIMFKRRDFRSWREITRPVGAGVQRLYVLPVDDGEAHIDGGQVTVFQVADVAGSDKTTADYTVVSTFARASVNAFPVLLWLDCRRRQFDELQVPSFLRDCADAWGRPPMWIETFGKGSAPFKILQRAGYPVRELKPAEGTRVDKIARAMSAIALYEAHRMFHPAVCEWVDPSLDVAEGELTTFPNAEHDDIVDTVSYAALVLPLLGGRQSVTVPTRRPIMAGVRGRQQW